MSLSENIRFYRKKQALSQDFVAKHLGYKSFTTIQKWETGLAEPPIGKLYELADLLHLDILDLLGESNNVNNSSVTLKNAISDFLYDHFPVGISAGQLQTVDPLMGIPKLPLPDIFMGKYARNKNVCIMHVNGESMNNVIADGAMIAVQRNLPLEQIKNGDIVVAKNNSGEYTIKRFFYIPEDKLVILRPDSSNLTFSDIRVHIDDVVSLNIFGKVVIYNVIL